MSHTPTQSHTVSTVTTSPHVAHAYLLPFTVPVFFAAGFAGAFATTFGAHFFAAVAFFGAAFAAFIGAAAFFIAIMPPLQVV